MDVSLGIFSPGQIAFLLAFAALVGACTGSFVNCMAWRMANGETVLKGRSHCTACGRTLKPFDVVPLFSWLFLRGKCRYCKARIPVRYEAVELIMAVLFAVAVYRFGLAVSTVAYLALFSILCGVALVDLDTKTIPNGFIIAGTAVWAASVWSMGVDPHVFTVGSMFAGSLGYGFSAVLVDGIAGAVAIGGGILCLSLVFDKVTGRDSLGGGDVKLLCMVSLYLGLAGGLLNLLVSCIAGLVFSIAWAFPRSASKGQASSGKDKRAFGQTPTTCGNAASGHVPTACEKAVSGQESAENRDAALKYVPSNGGKAASGQESDSLKTKAFPFGPAIAVSTVFTLFAGPAFLTWYVGLLL